MRKSTPAKPCRNEPALAELRDRVARLQAEDFDCIPNAEFSSPDFGEESIAWSGPPRAVAGDRAAAERLGRMPAYLAKLCSAPLLSAAEEQLLFKRMNYLKFRAAKLRRQLERKPPTRELVELLEEHVADIHAARDRIVEGNLRLVVSIVKKFVNENNAFEELVSEGVMSLLRAVEKFDYQYGFRFSTYATQAIRRSVYRALVARQKERLRFAAAEGTIIEELSDERPEPLLSETRWEAWHGKLGKLLGRLDKRERMIVKARFGLDGGREPPTLQALAKKLGVCKERVRQLQQRALDKLQSWAAELEEHVDDEASAWSSAGE